MSVKADFQGRSIDLRQIRNKARVSDHALLRYLERVLGVPVEQIRKTMLSDTVLLAMALKAPSVRAADHQLVFGQDNPFTIATVLAPEMRIRRSRRRKARWQTFREQR
jgi:hypothetical protein